MSIIQAIIGTNLTISGGGPPSVNVYGWSDPMNEGVTNTIYVQYENYPGTTIWFEIVNGSTGNSDWQGGSVPSGNAYIQGTGQTSFSWTTDADLTTEGLETYYLRIGTSQGGTDIFNQELTITDSSVAPFLYADFTVEWWDKTESGDAYPRPWAVGQWPNHKIAISYESASDYFWLNETIIGITGRLRIGQGWKHNAFVRHNGTVKGYINGIEYFSGSGNTPLVDQIRPLYVGTGGTNGDYKGYIKDLHIIKGYAKYTGNFTPPISPITTQTGSVFHLPVAGNGSAYDDVISYKSATLSGNVTYSEDDPYTYPTTTFTAVGYGDKLITPSPYPANLRIGLKVSDGQGWSDYIIDPNYFGNIKLLSLPAVLPPSNQYTVAEETSVLTININYTDGNSIEGRFSQNTATVALSAVRAGWTYQDPNGGTGTIANNAFISGESVFLVVPDAILGTWTFTPPVNGGSLYFDGNSSYINYGASADWAMDFDNISSDSLTLNLDANNPVSYSGTGSTWNDLSIGNFPYTLYGSPTYTISTPGNFNFNGSSQYATGPAVNMLPASAYSKMVWFRLNNTTADNNLVSSEAGGHFMYFNNSNRLYAGHANVIPFTTFGSTMTFNADTWYCAVVTFSVDNGIKLYVNGALDASDPAYQTPHNGNGSTNIACFSPGGNLLNGKIGRVLCYSKELTAGEVLQNFNATRNRYGI